MGGFGKGSTGARHGYHHSGITNIQEQEREGYRGVSSDHRGLTEKHNTTAIQGAGDVRLVVSIKRSLLLRVPGMMKGAANELPVSAVVHPAATLQSHDDVYQSHGQVESVFPVKHEPMDTDENSVLIPVVQQRPPPEGVCPGVDGCIGLDGYWYEWTEHIMSHDAEVTVMPYVYFEDCDTP